jgi:hypothetical protein
VSDRPAEPDPEAAQGDLDTSSEPEPDWAEGIRRGRRERAERLRRLLDASDGTTEETPP